jgi:hypothetical protein
MVRRDFQAKPTSSPAKNQRHAEKNWRPKSHAFIQGYPRRTFIANPPALWVLPRELF